MFARHSDAVFELVRESALIDSAQLEQLYADARTSGKGLAETLIDRRVVTRRQLLEEVALATGCEYAAELPATLSPEVASVITAEVARRYGVIPLQASADVIDVVVLDPFDGRATEDLPFLLDRQVRRHVGDPVLVERLISQHYGSRGDAAPVAEGSPDLDAAAVAAEKLSETDLEALAAQTPIIHFVNLVLTQAIRDKASDIHFEPFEQEFKIRYRIDGALYDMSPPPKALALPIASRLKVLANLNIAERRVPQDGRIKLMLAGRSVDLRVSTLPTQFGESIVLRVLDQSAVRLNLRELGLRSDVLAGVEDVIRRPNGIFIVTGPTGSGKTTTLYSCIRALNNVETKILTAEDPVEYEIEGVMQVPVNPGIGFPFASALRSFLRQDPDVIMVGEIRDLETAQIAIQAALTGHLVLTTLHTNDAAGAVARLSDMGIEPFLIANTLSAVLAQRLLRRVCPSCRTPVDVASELLEQSGIDRETAGRHGFFRGSGCPDCVQTGYRGRLGIFEWLPMTETLRELVVNRTPALQLRQAAIAEGMTTLREDALRALWSGTTSLDEVVRYT